MGITTLLFSLALASQAADAGPALTAYPQEWIDTSFAATPGACGHLVYKQGCSKLRKGRVQASVTLADSGKVMSVVVEENTVTVDPALVAACVKKDLLGRMFHPPEAGMAHVFGYVLVLAHKC